MLLRIIKHSPHQRLTLSISSVQTLCDDQGMTVVKLPELTPGTAKMIQDFCDIKFVDDTYFISGFDVLYVMGDSGDTIETVKPIWTHQKVRGDV